MFCVGALLVLILLYMSSIDRLYFRVVYPTFLIAGCACYGRINTAPFVSNGPERAP